MALRTVTAYWRELKAKDPNCAIGLSYLRTAVETGVIPSFKVGNRRVIESDTAQQYLFKAANIGGGQDEKQGDIRRVSP